LRNVTLSNLIYAAPFSRLVVLPNKRYSQRRRLQ